MRYSMVEHGLERICREGLEGHFREQGIPSSVQSRLEYIYQRSIRNLLSIYSTKGMFTTPGVTPLLESRSVGGSKDPAPWKVEKAVCYFACTD